VRDVQRSGSALAWIEGGCWARRTSRVVATSMSAGRDRWWSRLEGRGAAGCGLRSIPGSEATRVWSSMHGW
jgi:hypothetical protein